MCARSRVCVCDTTPINSPAGLYVNGRFGGGDGGTREEPRGVHLLVLIIGRRQRVPARRGHMDAFNFVRKCYLPSLFDIHN